jgi:hypothetical protein
MSGSQASLLAEWREMASALIDTSPCVVWRLTYQRVSSPFPVTSYKGTVEVFESFDSRAIVVWTVDFDSEPKDSATVAEALRTGIGAGVDGMERKTCKSKRDSDWLAQRST